MCFRWISAGLAALLAFASPASACTGIRLIAADGSVVPGRTLEFGFDLQSDVIVIPKGTAIAGSTPDGAPGLRYTTKYGMAGANAVGLPDIIDGINDQGLYVGLFYFPGYASYPAQTPENTARGMAPFEYGNWLLGNFASIEEVRANFDKAALLPVVLDAIKIAPPVHFVIHDRSGKSIVIEPVEGGLRLHENPLGVVTNSPTFDWHMTNLKNYVNLSVTNVPPIASSGVEIAQFGEGSGLRGLPGDYTPPSRFVRAAVFSQAAPQSATGREAVLQAFHILNAFDIPLGSVREKAGGDTMDYTLWTSVADLTALKWHFRTFGDQSIRSVDLTEALKGAGGKIKFIKMDAKQPIEDVSKELR